MAFARDVARFRAKVVKQKDDVFRALWLEVFKGLHIRAPVKTGQYRTNWRVGVDRPVIGLLKPPKGRRSLVFAQPLTPQEVAKASPLLKARAEQQVHFTNAVPYAERIERGWSGMAPGGVVGPTIRNVLVNFDRIVASVTRGF